MSAGEFATIVIKPDAEERGLEQEIHAALVAQGLEVRKIGKVRFDLQFVRDFYQWSEIINPEAIGSYICITPLQYWIATGDGAVQKAMRVKWHLRTKYCRGPVKNLFHSPNSQEEAERQFNLLKQRKITMNSPRQNRRNQVEAIVYRTLASGEISYLMLKRTPARGGFWQPVTGKVEEHESFENAATREIAEELGITNVIRLVDTGYSYEFTENGIDQFEKIFGAQVSTDQKVTLSSEHTEYQWVSRDEALNTYLRYPGNKEGLRKLHEMLTITGR